MFLMFDINSIFLIIMIRNYYFELHITNFV